IYTLELLNLPHTGPSTLLYDPTKELMKYVAYCEGVKTPAYFLIEKISDVENACKFLQFPMFVKPAKAGDSLGVDEHSLVHDKNQLKEKVENIIDEYDEVLVEEYIDGREFTVLVAANADGKTSTAFRPVEFIFPEGNRFKTYALKTSELHPDANIPVTDVALDKQLREYAQRIFKSFNGVGYARMDFRMNNKGEIFFLEINFTCSVFYKDGYEGSADYILKYDGVGQSGFLHHIIAEGIARHNRKQKCYVMKGNSIAGFGIYANRDIKQGEIIFLGEGKSQRLATRRFVENNWNENDKEIFRRYAYPVSKEIFLLWDDNPAEWAPQNHCCDANTGYVGLNVVALKDILKGEELTLDYTSFLDENMEPFNCTCGSKDCRGLIKGIKNNSLTEREGLPNN
ncbi:MAG: ATP-grasp domain-containing protein, partial [Bacteroidota bacterium]|nr:ATP-grasp domain-containing protein [Bacteroidota bacterium]